MLNGTPVVDERPSLKDICGFVTPLFAPHWKKIGLFLDLSDATLKIIEANNPKSVEDCCNAVFQKWLELTPDATWRKIFSVIESPVFLFYASRLIN